MVLFSARLVAVAQDVFKDLNLKKSVSGNVSDEVGQSTASRAYLDQPENSAFNPALTPIYAKPIKLSAKTLDVSGQSIKLVTTLDLNLVEVGVDHENRMKTPDNWDEGGWYLKSSRPGEEGNLIINAHYDDALGNPAAFWNLKVLKVGDIVGIQDSLGRTYKYQVTEKFYLGVNAPDRLQVLEDEKDKSTITLIACGGVWLFDRSTYSDRLVVKGELVDKTPTIS